MTPPARFVVGTGRCGSTLLSRMLATHRDVASIHEFFTGLDWGKRFAAGEVTGAELAGIVAAEQPVTTRVLGLGYTSDEITYPFDRPGSPYRPGDPVPWLLVSMLSWLTDDPDSLFDRLVERASAAPTRPLADQYRDLFTWLAEQAGKSAWVERSGSSIDYVADLARLYPDARFVHIHRDGLEAALSIRAHPFFRLALAILFDLFPTDVELGPDGDDAPLIRHVVEQAPPLWCAGQYWSDQVVSGYAALPHLDRSQWLDVRFEDLLAEPQAVMRRIAVFLDLTEDADFPESAAALVGTPPRPRAAALTPAERDELAAACRPGQRLLGRA